MSTDDLGELQLRALGILRSCPHGGQRLADCPVRRELPVTHLDLHAMRAVIVATPAEVLRRTLAACRGCYTTRVVRRMLAPPPKADDQN